MRHSAITHYSQNRVNRAAVHVSVMQTTDSTEEDRMSGVGCWGGWGMFPGQSDVSWNLKGDLDFARKTEGKHSR